MHGATIKNTTCLFPQARNKEQEGEILQWIQEVTEQKLPSQPYEDVLRDGVVLCNLINKIAPGSVKKIQAKGTNFQLMENIQRYRKLTKQLTNKTNNKPTNQLTS